LHVGVVSNKRDCPSADVVGDFPAAFTVYLLGPALKAGRLYALRIVVQFRKKCGFARLGAWREI
jgi:hypothetical protein